MAMSLKLTIPFPGDHVKINPKTLKSLFSKIFFPYKLVIEDMKSHLELHNTNKTEAKMNLLLGCLKCHRDLVDSCVSLLQENGFYFFQVSITSVLCSVYLPVLGDPSQRDCTWKKIVVVGFLDLLSSVFT